MAANFWTSSHRQRWLFDKTYVEKNSNGKDTEVFGGGRVGRANVLILRTYFIEYIHKLGQQLQLRQKVLATAVVFFKRLYLKASFCEFDPRLVAPTVLFIAAKAEETLKLASVFIKALESTNANKLENTENVWPYSLDDLLEMEFYALEFLRCDLVVFHPYRPLTKYLSDAKMLGQEFRMAWQIVNDSYRTDLCLIFPPYLIAVAAVYMACSFLGKSTKAWLEMVNVKPEVVAEICKEMLDLYQRYDNQKKKPDIGELLSKLDPIFQSQYKARSSSTNASRPHSSSSSSNKHNSHDSKGGSGADIQDALL
eukprot:gb/GEZN01011317.1/.p1 GENE.gb/GEZN01011317.1/~~gb/GEZN01011317.1/.p1  ORF type:complete len:310 (+),score=60.05 gb/GEZN01011317.1/:160-1089(+)